MPAQLLYGAAVVLSAVLAAFFGGARERAGVVVVAVLGAAWVLASENPRAHDAAWICMILDLCGLAWLAKVAWRAPRSWPVWALAPQAVAVAVSLAFLLQPDVSRMIYFRALLMTHGAVVLALMAGTSRRQAAHS
jgi:hypothetical protein